MHQHALAKSTWYVITLLLAVILGIWPGIALTQSLHLVLIGGLFGWFTFPLALLNLIAGTSASDPTLQHLVLAACGYPLAMLGYSVCASQAMKYMTKEKVFLLLLFAASVSTLVSMPTDAITRSITQSQDILTNDPLSFAITYTSVLFQLFISGLLGWLIALLENRQEEQPAKRNTPEPLALASTLAAPRRKFPRRMVTTGLATLGGVSISGGVIWWFLTPHPFSIYRGHSGSVRAIAWSPDGKYIASGSDDAAVQVWNVTTGLITYTYHGHISRVDSVSWSPDSKYIASGSGDRTVQMWNATNGTRILVYKGHTDWVISVAWSPDGKHIASGSDDYTAQVWDAATGTLLFTYKGHSDAVVALAWSPDSKHIASSGGKDYTMQMWNATDGSPVSTDNLFFYGQALSLSWSPNGKHIASGSDDSTVQVWDA